ncbi:UDP-2,4-diacetamido-2,4,6-trideoxy-beta-L-altropyranose hydrolase [Pseudomonas mucidolens]|uniref:UDP-2,4-diacetamido-2,4, 6-trideoxy-beta-L-altropyranose hydrolase n=1 Tax=Pseudomonas mucidolens TaxID=46679 RepID=UPI0030D845E1
MKVVFRADASLQIGSGHVMRCLTLACALREKGTECHFICREHPGHLLNLIRDKGFTAYGLSINEPSAVSELRDAYATQPAHASWLGATQTQDAESCAAILETVKPDWLIVDHYALDVKWENLLRKFFNRLLVIDDLADRKHECDLLLDQNLGHTDAHYAGLVTPRCELLVGPKYALLRPEFSHLREKSIARRDLSRIQHILITMGGVDQNNATGATLRALRTCLLSDDCTITVVMGLKAPCLDDVVEVAAGMQWPTEVLSNVTDMGERMATADLVIGAAGSTSWERCCLGVPTIMVVLADNQISGARALQQSGSVVMIEHASEIPVQLPLALESLSHGDALQTMSESARKISDGLGIQRVVKKMGFNNV